MPLHPLTLAACSDGSQLDEAGASACALVLLERGCDFNLRDKFKCTALHRAAGLQYNVIIVVLIIIIIIVIITTATTILLLLLVVTTCNPMSAAHPNPSIVEHLEQRKALW